jgi:hypothetical protein
VGSGLGTNPFHMNKIDHEMNEEILLTNTEFTKYLVEDVLDVYPAE